MAFPLHSPAALAAVIFTAATPGSLFAQAARADDAVQLDRVSVSSTRADDYAAATAPVSTKLPLSLLETPQAITVVSRSLMDDQGVRRLDHALANVAGVTAGGYFSDWDYYRIRGFDVSYNGTYLDGMLNDSSPAEETFALERVEVVKGPASSLYGQGSLGGFVNLVSKRPSKNRTGEIQLTVGSYREREATLDVNRPLNASGTTYGRLNVLFHESDSPVNFAGSSRFFIAPSLTWEIGPDTSLTLLTSYRDARLDLAFGLPAAGTVLPNPNGPIRHDLYIGNPKRGNDEREETTRLGYEFKHRFNPAISLRHSLRRYQVDFTSDDLAYPDYPESMEDDRTLRLSGYRAIGKFHGWRTDTALDATFSTGSVKHTLVAGLDYRFGSAFYDSQSSEPVYFDVYAPDYAAFPDFIYGPHDIYNESSSDFGFYFQDQLELTSRLALTLGGRYDYSVFDATPDALTDKSFTPRAGLTFEIEPGTVVYTNYSESFNPQWFFVDESGHTLEPETGVNYEIGLKTSLPDGRITTTFALFELTRKNVATPNLASPAPDDFIVSGEQRSRGAEFETSLRLAPGWHLTAAYAYIDATITEDNDLPVGEPLLGVARHMHSLWTKYTFQRGPFKNFGIGVGVHGYSKQSGDLYHSFDLPAYTLVDLGLYYTRGNFNAQINFDNLLDREFYAGSYDYLYVLPGDPLIARLSVGWKF